MKQYLDRAEYIKKTAMKGPETQIAPKDEDVNPPSDGASASATAKKGAKSK